MRFGFEYRYVVNLDLESFDALVIHMLRVERKALAEQAWLHFVTAQCSGKDVKKFIDEIEKGTG